jgi:hypothetical protein
MLVRVIAQGIIKGNCNIKEERPLFGDSPPLLTCLPPWLPWQNKEVDDEEHRQREKPGAEVSEEKLPGAEGKGEEGGEEGYEGSGAGHGGSLQNFFSLL